MTTRVPLFKTSTIQLFKKDMKKLIVREKLSVGDVVLHGHLLSVVGQPDKSNLRFSIVYVSCQLSALFADPIAAYEAIIPQLGERKKKLHIELYANHPCLVKYCSQLESRWYKVIVQYTGTVRNVIVFFAKDFIHQAKRLGYYDFEDIEIDHDLPKYLERELIPRRMAYILMRSKVFENEYISEKGNFRSVYRVTFPDGEEWHSDGVKVLYDVDEPTDRFEIGWKSTLEKYESDILKTKKLPTNNILLGEFGDKPRLVVRPEMQLASKYVHEIILDVVLCFSSFIDAPYVILWILDQMCYTKYNYGRQRVHVIEAVYASIRKVNAERSEKRIKL